MVFLGIDPGTKRAGYGIVSACGIRFSYIAHGIIPITSREVGVQLVELRKGLNLVLNQHKCDVCGIEKLFFEVNRKTAMAVAQARGVLMLTAIEYGLRVYEVAPTEVKLALSGNGRASKGAVAKMVGIFLGLDTSGFLDDEVDALAVAIATPGLMRVEGY